MSEERNSLRGRMLAARDGITPSLRAENSGIIQQRLMGMEEILRARQVMLYVNFRSEVETIPLFALLAEKKIAVSAPLTLVGERRLVPYPIGDFKRDLKPGYCGILEPDSGSLKPLDPAKIDVVIVPGSAFDEKGGRLGYGGGYYDRFLAQDAPQAIRIGVAFEAQLVPALPLLPHDQPLHYLVTEKMIRKTGG